MVDNHVGFTFFFDGLSLNEPKRRIMVHAWFQLDVIALSTKWWFALKVLCLHISRLVSYLSFPLNLLKSLSSLGFQSQAGHSDMSCTVSHLTEENSRMVSKYRIFQKGEDRTRAYLVWLRDLPLKYFFGKSDTLQITFKEYIFKCLA